MPELPDIALYLHALAPRVVGQRLERVRIASPFLLRTADPPIADLAGRTVRAVRRLGKRIVLALDGDYFAVLHLMVAGRLHWKPLGAPIPRRSGLAAFDFSPGTLLLTEAGTKHRAALHVVRGMDALAAHDPGGLDVLSASLEQFWTALARESHTLTRETLTAWIERLQVDTGDAFPEKVTAFRKGMAVHGRFRQPCPVCGSPIQRIRYAENEVNYCATCQTGGRLLADRSLSRLLKQDWPCSLAEWEERAH